MRYILALVAVLLVLATIPAGGTHGQPAPELEPRVYLPLVLKPPPTPTASATPLPSPTPTAAPRGFMWKRMPEVIKIFEDAAGLSAHVVDGAYIDAGVRSHDIRWIRASNGREFKVYTVHEEPGMLGVQLGLWNNADLCERGFPEWCDFHYGMLENVLWSAKDGGPWVLEYVRALEAICANDTACDWGSLEVYPRP